MNWKTLTADKRILFTVFLLVIFAYALIDTRNFQQGAQVFPMIISIPALLLCLFDMFLSIRRTAKGQVQASGSFVDIATDTSISTAQFYKSGLKYLIWILALYVVMWFIGFKVGISLFFIAFLRIEAKYKWWVTLLLTAIAVYLTFVHFTHFMGVHWPDSVVGRWFDLPWL